MNATEELRYREEEFFAIDAIGEKEGKRYEFHDGEIFIVPDVGIQHNQVLTAVIGALNQSLKGKQCQILSSSQKINVKTRSFYCYPDIVAICGKIETHASHKDVITNPVLIVEILSSSTQDYDRGEKFRLYRNIPSLKEYICISSLEVSLEKFDRKENGFWTLKEYNSLENSILIESLDVGLVLSEVYEKVEFEED